MEWAQAQWSTGRKTDLLRFADNIGVYHEEQELKKMLRELKTESAKVGLTMNTTKTYIRNN